jgi:hypothetical protein
MSARADSPPQFDVDTESSQDFVSVFGGDASNTVEVANVSEMVGGVPFPNMMPPSESSESSQSDWHVLTSEQQAVVDLVVPVSKVRNSRGHVVHVTSGAGTGKTTTLEAVARRLHEMGHNKIVYMTFNRAAAQDASRRLLASGVSCKTLDAQALACLRHVIDQDRGQHIADRFVLIKIRTICENDISREVALVGNISARKQAAAMVAGFIYDTLQTFLRSSLPYPGGFDSGEVQTPRQALEWHRSQMIPGVSSDPGRLYTKCAMEAFEVLRPSAVAAVKPQVEMTFAFVMKEVQLLHLEIDATAILVDECQDCNSVQLEWILQQRTGRHIFFVGDAMQRIYTFRGAAPSSILLSVEGIVNMRLTESFRFGPEIASVANLVLHMMATGMPAMEQYTLKGSSPWPGRLLEPGACEGIFPRTILAFQNVTLLVRALELLARNTGIRIGVDDAASRAWAKAVVDLPILHSFYSGDVTSLPVDRFPEVAGEDVAACMTWKHLCDMVRSRSLSRLSLPVAIINRFQSETLKVILEFEELVIKKQWSQPDVTLSTIHSSKGLEWDTVEILDDVVELTSFSVDVPSDEAHFLLPKQCGDVSCLLYVALTRARQVLCVPTSVVRVMDAFSRITAISDAVQKGESSCSALVGATDAVTIPVPPDHSQKLLFWPPFTSSVAAMRGVVVNNTAYQQCFSVTEVLTLQKTLVGPWRSLDMAIEIEPGTWFDEAESVSESVAKKARTAE